jgi:urate oxidase
MGTRPIEEAEAMISLVEDRYGKSRVRLVRVKRGPAGHDFREWMVEILLRGDFTTCFTDGDNSKILPTDTMKNTVYSVARHSPAESIEDFAKELIDFFLGRNPQVSSAEINISEKPWAHLVAGGKSHPAAFVQSGGELQTAKVSRTQGGKFSVESGLQNLIIMKTADSGFEGYIHDSLTTLPETADRLFGTAVRANWRYVAADLAFLPLREKIRDALLAAFAGHASKSVQHTLYAMAEAALERVVEIDEIELTMPNIHCLLVDLSRFGQDNPNEIFVPTDEPHGTIQARMRREP